MRYNLHQKENIIRLNKTFIGLHIYVYIYIYIYIRTQLYNIPIIYNIIHMRHEYTLYVHTQNTYMLKEYVYTSVSQYI